MLQLTVIVKGIDHICQALSLFNNCIQILLLHLLIRQAVCHCFGISLDHCDRCFQIMGNICQHALLFHDQMLFGTFTFLKLHRHPVKAAENILKFPGSLIRKDSIPFAISKILDPVFQDKKRLPHTPVHP